MARRVFFSFHHEGDLERASQIRNCWLTKPNHEDAGFVDAAAWESIKEQEDDAVKRWIGNQLDRTSVTVVLIGSETANCRWVLHEISESHRKGKGVLGIYIHNCKDLDGRTCSLGANPFRQGLRLGSSKDLGSVYPVYDWVSQDGYRNLGTWVEEAAGKTGK